LKTASAGTPAGPAAGQPNSAFVDIRGPGNTSKSRSTGRSIALGDRQAGPAAWRLSMMPIEKFEYFGFVLQNEQPKGAIFRKQLKVAV
jgi:hypothetical protein